MGKPLILGLVGQQGQGILYNSSVLFCCPFEKLGYESAVIDFKQPDAKQKLDEILRTKDVFFAFGFAGVGARFSNDKGIIWDQLRIPFLSFFNDHPAYNPHQHCVNSRYVVNVYWTKDFFDTQRLYLRGPQQNFLLKPQFSAHFPRPDKPHHIREIDYLFLKNGRDPDEVSRPWKDWPKTSYEIVWDCIRMCETRSDLLIADVVAKRGNVSPEEINADANSFWGMVQCVDDYIRCARSTWMVNMLKKIPATIIGEGWDHIDRTGAKAKFLPPVDAEKVIDLYRNSKYIFNTNPYFVHNVHERVMEGLDSLAAVISDNNCFTRQYLQPLRSYFGYEWNDPFKEDRILTYLAEQPLHPYDFYNGWQTMDSFNNTGQHVQSIFDIVQQVGYDRRHSMSGVTNGKTR